MGNSSCTDITVIDDAIVESTEAFQLALIAVNVTFTTITPGSSTAVVMIVEDNVDCK